MIKLLASFYLFTVTAQIQNNKLGIDTHERTLEWQYNKKESTDSIVEFLKNTEIPIILSNINTLLFQQLITHKGIDSEYSVQLNVPFTLPWNDSVCGTPEFHSLFFDNKEPLIIIGSSQSGSIILFTDQKSRTKLYTMNTGRSRTSTPKLIQGFFNGGFQIHSATIDLKGEIVVFSSRRIGSIGGYDLFCIVISDNHNALSIRNISPNINSIYNEIYPQFTQNDSTLLFSSDRKGGFGGFDIYYSKCSNNGDWDRVYNIGPKINTVKHDLRLYPYNNREKAIITRQEIDNAQKYNTILTTDSLFKTDNNNLITERTKMDRHNTAFPIKGVVSRKAEKQNETLQVSILDICGTLMGTTNVDTISGIFGIEIDSKVNKYISVSGNNIRAVTRKILVPQKYNYPVYITDFAVDMLSKNNENTFNVYFNHDSEAIDSMQLIELHEWLQKTKKTSETYLINGNRIQSNSKSEIVLKRWNYIRKQLASNGIRETNISEKVFWNFYQDEKTDRDKPDIFPENRIFTISTQPYNYPKYSVIDLSDVKHMRNQIENQTIYVQIRASVQPIDSKILPDPDNILLIIDNNGIYRYIYAFDDVVKARQKQKQLKTLGYSSTALLLIIK